MMSLVRGEVIKLRRSLPLRLTLACPVITVAIQWLVFVNQGKMQLKFWPLWINQVQTFWALLILPALIPILTASLASLEHTNDTWKQLKVLPCPRWQIFGTKALATESLIAVSFLLLFVAAVLGGVLLCAVRRDYEPLNLALIPGFLTELGEMYLCCMLATSVQLWLSMRFRSFTLPVSVGICALATGVILVRNEHLGPWFPWTLAIDIIAYGRAHALTALVLGVLGGMSVAFLGCLDVMRQDVD